MSALKNEKQEMFSQEYLIDFNATQAAIRAGYSVKSAGQLGCEMLKNPNVRARIDELMAERSRRTGISQDRVVVELARIAFLNAPDVVDTDSATLREDASKDDTAAIASVRVKRKVGDDFSETEREIRFADKIKSLELLGKHLGMFADRLIVTDRPEIIDDVP